MTKNEILEYFKDINHAYNDCTRYDTLKRMLDELQEPCGDAISRQAVLDLIEHYNSDGLGSVFYGYEQGVKFADAVNKLPPVTAEKVGRWTALEEWKKDFKGYVNSLSMPRDDYNGIMEYIDELPVTPQYTDAEIQKMQDLEFAEIQKAYEIGKAEGSEVLDKIRVEIDEQYDRVHPYNISCAEGLEMALDIIDKYKASPTGADES